jgi:hypothetical protein
VVRWPSGTIDTIGTEAADQELEIKEGKGVVDRRPGARIGAKP